MKWAIYWRPRPDAPWRPWTDRLFQNKTAAWNHYLQDGGWQDVAGRPGYYWRGHTQNPMVASRTTIMRRAAALGIRLARARIVCEAPALDLEAEEGVVA